VLQTLYNTGLFNFLDFAIMPIYAYRCTECHHAQDILRKISDPPLTLCTACGKDGFVKQVTAAGFALKGTGWYVTDFRGDGSGSKSSDGTASAPKTTEIAPSKTAADTAPTSTSAAASTTPTPPSTTAAKPPATNA
jgi:putative FmdB family regulatory protein